MPLFLLKIAKWLVGKGLVFGIAIAIAVGAFALWIFATRSYEAEGQRIGELVTLRQHATEVYGELESAHQRLIALGQDIEDNRRKLEAANRAIEYLDGILERITRLFTQNSKERTENERRLAQEKAERQRLLEEQAKLVEEQSGLRIRRVSLTERAKELEREIASLEGAESGFVNTLQESWSSLKPYLIVGVASAIALPVAWKLFAFYLWAPLLSLGGPIRLQTQASPTPRISESRVSTQIALQPGQKAWVRESFLQASDEGLPKKTRFVLNWSIPATCLAAGLVELVEFSSGETSGQLTVSSQSESDFELASVELPEGGRLVLRPSSIVAVVSYHGEPVSIDRRWRLFHPQSWLTLQFRYFIFKGPCALLVKGVRGVRFEVLDTPEGKGRRTNQISTLGFTPDLTYGAVRAETFWSYFRGFNPLFDDVFRGRGMFVCEEISKETETKAGRFWSGLWGSLLKVLGV
ncbi:hypothetical protein [Pelagicoccus sp. SDUM812003]|uniref:hypothetical protein n=1 Tax=Pelagicoccus sp. SDUM812003 TaxID=3041267 RepID=UPI00280F2971|nr:hypothetical protein [Pelagicoccus sp. SDUM812003]MDQ8205411.1 hypothetical protein [Pelagicoccus sp. SDUM812003]